MIEHSSFRLQLIVFALVATSFINIYLTQPVLPILQNEFSVDIVTVSFTVSAVILGITISNLGFGLLADKFSIQPIILVGGTFVAFTGLICAMTENFLLFIGARFLQGLFIPSLTTCLAAHLAKTLPAKRLNIVMGSYVSATVVGGLGSRLLGGWIHPPLHWRHAFLSASVLTLIVTLIALLWLPKTSGESSKVESSIGFPELLKSWPLLRIFFSAAGSFAIFSSIFNYLPYRLGSPPLNFTTEVTTMFYLVYIVGIFIGPFAGRISNQFGSGHTLLVGSLVLGAGLLLVLSSNIIAILSGLLWICAGFFTIHAAAVGALNNKLTSSQGRANALYVLFYYVGGWVGITGCGLVYNHGGWSYLVTVLLFLLIFPIITAIGEYNDSTSNCRERKKNSRDMNKI
ncbi:MAG: MFS transporter [Desulfobulbaceae bacterium]|nr:MFS transporter [Desulfobulbaceae bacterium]